MLYTQKELDGAEYQLHCCIKNIAIIELQYSNTMQISELHELKRSDIDL